MFIDTGTDKKMYVVIIKCSNCDYKENYHIIKSGNTPPNCNVPKKCPECGKTTVSVKGYTY